METGESVLAAPGESAVAEHGSVSACLVVRNEQAMIERCLRSLTGVVDEIVLVHDGECEDATLQIAARYGARIFVRPLTGHAEATTIFAFEQARGEWIMSLDADEFLSDDLRGALRQLVADEHVNGYELLWRQWDGQRYITENGPFKLSLFRRACVHALGIHHSAERVDPPVKRIDLQLEHRPAYNNFTLRTVLSKWRRSAKIHAEQLLSDFADIPKFNWDGPADWSWQRRALNALSPLLCLPYIPVVTLVNFARERHVYDMRENLRMSIFQGLYAGMLQFYVAKYRYLGPAQSPAAEPPRPGAAGARPLA
jgi:glycosyltransferase involved in cell wall biosynthesis